MPEHRCLAHNDAPEPTKLRGQCSTYWRTYDREVEAWLKVPAGPYGERPQFECSLSPCRWANEAWPEPHEGIIGTERYEDTLLWLEPEHLKTRRIIAAIGFALKRATTVGNPAPIVARMAERYGGGIETKSLIGDLVIESTTLYGNRPNEDDRRWAMGFGILVDVRCEWASSHEDHNAYIESERKEYEKWGDEFNEDDFRRFLDTIYYVQYGPNPEAICRWTNCSFTSLPLSLDDVRALERPMGYRDGNATVITKDSLLGSLADSGFDLRPIGA